MSEYIAHIAAHDDCYALAKIDPLTSEWFLLALEHYPRVSRLGAVASRGDDYTVELLREAREAWPSEAAEKMLAFLFGWRTHLAADRALKTLFRLLEPEVYLSPELDSPSRMSIYQDLYLLREHYQDGARSPFHPGMLRQDHPCTPLDNLFAASWQVGLLGLHAFDRRVEQAEDWFAELLGVRQKFYVDVRRYDSEFSAIHDDYMEEVVKTHRFYDPDDGLIQLARAKHSDTSPPEVTIEESLEAAKVQSHYARALRRGCLYLRAASAFLRDEIGLDELRLRFDVGVPHTSREVYGALDNPARREELLRQWHEGRDDA